MQKSSVTVKKWSTFVLLWGATNLFKIIGSVKMELNLTMKGEHEKAEKVPKFQASINFL
jgi:hypothetical protein